MACLELCLKSAQIARKGGRKIIVFAEGWERFYNGRHQRTLKAGLLSKRRSVMHCCTTRVVSLLLQMLLANTTAKVAEIAGHESLRSLLVQVCRVIVASQLGLPRAFTKIAGFRGNSPLLKCRTSPDYCRTREAEPSAQQLAATARRRELHTIQYRLAHKRLKFRSSLYFFFVLNILLAIFFLNCVFFTSSAKNVFLDESSL